MKHRIISLIALFMPLLSMAQAWNWKADTEAFDDRRWNSETMVNLEVRVGVVSVGNFMVGAFVDGELRGFADKAVLTPTVPQRYLYTLRVKGDTEDMGKNISFKVVDIRSDIEYSGATLGVSRDVAWNGETVSLPSDPLVLSVVGPKIAESVQVESGFSFFRQDYDMYNLLDLTPLYRVLPAIAVFASVRNASDIPAPKMGGLGSRWECNWFADPDDQLARNLRAEIDETLDAVRDSTGMNIVAVYIDEYDGDIKALAKDIHDQWHLASITGLKDNGIVLLVVNKGDKAYIYTGIEASHKLPRDKASLIVSRRIKPRMAKGNDVQAIIDGANAIQQLILHPESAQEMANEPEAHEDINVWWVGGLCLAALLIAIVVKRREKKS